MPKISCCLCSRRTETNKQRVRVGTDSIWPLLTIHSEKNGLDMNTFSTDDYVCTKCHSILSHYRMKDRGQNKIIKDVTPTAHEPGITKSVLRSSSKSSTNAVAAPDVSVGGGESSSERPKKSSSVTNEKVKAANEDVDTLTDVEPVALVTTHESPAISDGPKDMSDAHISTSQSTVVESGSQMTGSSQIRNSSSDVESHLQVTKTNSTTMNVIPLVVTEMTVSADSPTSGTVPVLVDSSSPIPMIINSNRPMSVTSRDLPSLAQESNTLQLQGVKATQSRCFICASQNGRKSLPWSAIRQVWFALRCYIPKTNRTCDEHLTGSQKFTDDALQVVESLKQSVNVKVKEFELWLHAVSDLSTTPYNFEENGIEAEKYKMFLGIGKDSFDDLVHYLKGMRNTSTRSLRTALAMFLLLLRNNMKQEIIAFNFSTTQQVVSKTIDAVSLALDEHFVPKHLGYYHITREEAVEKHSILLTSKVLEQAENRLCLIADGTYNYIEKPSDFELQRKTFSAHKYRNLLKPLYIVFPTGYILEAAGPYFCDAKNNDAANIRHHYKNSDLLLFLEDDDFFLFDRGYRDVVDETVANGQSVFMPSLLTGKRTHFTCAEANSSRKVTMFRWVVEAVNGRIKNVFPFFKHTIEGTYVPKIMRFNRIACAIMNKYFPLLFNNKEFHNIISEVCSGEIPETNELKEEVEELGLKRMTTRWERASASSVTDFPELSMEDLKRITLGSYQVTIAERYIDSHLKENSEFGIFIHREKEDVIRSRIRSRFSNSKTHDAWVKFEKNGTGYSAIKGLYCTCKVGERTLGCCSHLTSIIRYLGFDRHQPQKVKRQSRFAWDAIDCGAVDCGDTSESDECDD